MKLVTLLLIGCGALAISATSAKANSFVEFDYNIFSPTNRARATVFIELYDDRPATTANFLQYINAGLYNNTLIHRMDFSDGGVPFVLQGGGYYPSYISEPTALVTSLNPNAQVDLDGNPFSPNPTVHSEFNNAPLRSNVKGTLAMFLNAPPDPNSASSQYFFNLSDNSSYLDFASGGYTVFAHVVGDGMSLIDTYAASLHLLDLNPDTNDDGTRDGGPFYTVPALTSTGSFLPLVLNKAKAVQYLGSGSTTTVDAGGFTFTDKDVFIDTGAVFTGAGAITIGVGRTLGVRENYAINRSLGNHGVLAPGMSLGVIGVQGNYSNYSDGTLSVQLAGTTVDSQYDRLIASGIAFLAGQLQVTTLANFAPTAGNSFTVLTAQSIVGNFNAFDLPQLTAGLVWSVNQSPNAITLLVVGGADFNSDGIVDAKDYVYWRKNNGTMASYQIWRDNLGNRSGGFFFANSASGGGGLEFGNVPEPSSGFLIGLASLVGGCARRRRASRLNSKTVRAQGFD